MAAKDRGLEELEKRLQAVYARLLAGERTATAEFAELVLSEYTSRGRLLATLKDGAGITMDEARDELCSIVGQFTAKFLMDPLKYAPDKGPLGAYINMAIQRDVTNAVEKAIRHKSRNIRSLDDPNVVEAVDRRNPQPTPEDDVIDREAGITPEQRERGLRFLAELGPEERECFQFMSEGIRGHELYADALGLTHLSVEAQRHQVNNVKDRLKKKMARLR